MQWLDGIISHHFNIEHSWKIIIIITVDAYWELTMLFKHFIHVALGGEYYYPHFTNVETEGER